MPWSARQFKLSTRIVCVRRGSPNRPYSLGNLALPREFCFSQFRGSPNRPYSLGNLALPMWILKRILFFSICTYSWTTRYPTVNFRNIVTKNKTNVSLKRIFGLCSLFFPVEANENCFPKNGDYSVVHEKEGNELYLVSWALKSNWGHCKLKSTNKLISNS